MEAFKIQGPVKLSGEITPQGAKNEALQVLAAVLLTDEEVTISNLPNILDVVRQIELLEGIGVWVRKLDDNTYQFQAHEINLDYLESEDFFRLASAIRGSVMLLGPLVARYKKGIVPKPGGDKIGRRKLDTHFIGLQMLGADFNYSDEKQAFLVTSNGLKGTYILLEEASVTGTANVVMAAVFAQGETQIYNAACEPYLQQLCRMLVSMGAIIEGIGTNLLRIQGVSSLSGCTHKCLPDMIEIGSFIGLAAMTGSAITIKDVRPDMLGLIPNYFRKLGIEFSIGEKDIQVPEQDTYEVTTNMDGSILTLADAPWPGFTPDLLSIALVIATQAKGNVLIHQKMFESRLFFVDSLLDMGAQIILCDPHRATVMGLGRHHPLRGISMRSPDIRAGVALLIAALSAQGVSTIYNISQIDRGYEAIDERL
nr:UDP-N-acetylglucosamine 1-carboxyvinyltransferase [Bacteroidota bacterium]